MAAEALLEANKFDAFNRLSAFVVHDLKNLIAQLQLLLSNAERHRNNPEFQRDMLSTVEHVVGKMHQLTMQLRPDASSIERTHPVDISLIARRVQTLRSRGRANLEIEAQAGLLVQGHEDRLERVIGHLVQNARGRRRVAVLCSNPPRRRFRHRVSDRQRHDPRFVRPDFQVFQQPGHGPESALIESVLHRIRGRIDVGVHPQGLAFASATCRAGARG